jgi:hypothetical protein
MSFINHGGSFSSSQDFEAEFFLGLVFVSEKQKICFDCGYIGTCRLLSVLKKMCRNDRTI